MRVGAVDIGTNSMRLLICDEAREYGRWTEVTGLGAGVDATGRLAPEAMERTLPALRRFGGHMAALGVERRAAVATSATRDARNRAEFLEQATLAIGTRPDVISGEEEARLAYSGATSLLGPGSWLVSDIGGGSTEFVDEVSGVSIDIGSVRLTDRTLSDRPASLEQVSAASAYVREMFEYVVKTGDLVGVAGTWTSLAAIALDLPAYSADLVHGHEMGRGVLVDLVSFLGDLTVSQTAEIPSLDPKRAPVILSGAVIALAVMDHLGASTALVSVKDSLDGLAASLLGLP